MSIETIPLQGPSRKRKEMEPEEEDSQQLAPIYIATDPKEAEKRRMTIAKILQYSKTFPIEYLKGVQIPNELHSLATEELVTLLNDIRFAVSQTNGQNMYSTAFDFGIVSTESILCTFTPIRAEGLSEVCKNDQNIKAILAELYLEQSINHYVCPQNRLLLSVLTSIAALHSHNINKPVLQLEKEIEDRWKDL